MVDLKPLHGTVAVVTGGGRGIGAAIAKRLAEIGAAVAICGRSKEPLLQTAKSITAKGGKALAVECDVTAYASVEKAAAQIAKDLGKATVLVNNAGVGAFSSHCIR